MMYPVNLPSDVGSFVEQQGVLVPFVGQDDIVDMPHSSADYHEGCVTRVMPSPWLTSCKGEHFDNFCQSEILLALVLKVLRLILFII
jgi:hypothetical protein